MNKALRAALVARSNGRCEACGRFADSLEADHFLGRAKAEESIATLWRLCRSCHHDKTSPVSAEKWLRRYAVHLAVASVDDPNNARIYFDALDRVMTKRATLLQKFGSLSSS